MIRQFLTSRAGLKIAALLTVLAALALVRAMPVAHPTTPRKLTAFREQVLVRWRAQHPNRADLQVIQIDVHFPEKPPSFAEGEGVVIAPVGIDLFRLQKVLEIESYPPHIRILSIDGITCLAWKYAGAVNRTLHFDALVLVQRYPAGPPDQTSPPSGRGLPADLRIEATATAADLHEHKLNECVVFPQWVEAIAGAPPATDQFLRIVAAIASKIDRDQKNAADDICAAIREDKFSLHRAQVLTVMAAREIGLPAYAFAAAHPKGRYTVGIFTEREGWRLIDLADHRKGFLSGAPALLTKAPLLAPFEGSRHDFWFPQAGVYGSSRWSGTHTIDQTTWKNSAMPAPPSEATTEANSYPLWETQP